MREIKVDWEDFEDAFIIGNPDSIIVGPLVVRVAAAALPLPSSPLDHNQNVASEVQ